MVGRTNFQSYHQCAFFSLPSKKSSLDKSGYDFFWQPSQTRPYVQCKHMSLHLFAAHHETRARMITQCITWLHIHPGLTPPIFPSSWPHWACLPKYSIDTFILDTGPREPEGPRLTHGKRGPQRSLQRGSWERSFLTNNKGLRGRK